LAAQTKHGPFLDEKEEVVADQGLHRKKMMALTSAGTKDQGGPGGPADMRRK